MDSQEDGQCNSNIALTLQGSPQGSNAYPLAINLRCKSTKRQPASKETCHEARMQMMIVKDARLQNFWSTHRLNEQAIYIVADCSRNTKREQILVNIEDYNIFYEGAGQPGKTTNFMQSAGNFWKAECKRLEKKLSDELISSKCCCLSSSQVSLFTLPSWSFRSPNILLNREKCCNRQLHKKNILEAQIFMSLSRHIFAYNDECLSFAYFYIFKICYGSRHRYTPSYDWAPNESVAICKFLFDIGEGDAILSLFLLVFSDIARTSFKIFEHPF